MWTALPFSRRLCLIALAFTMLRFAPEGLACCHKSFSCKQPKIIKQCHEQKVRHNCPHHAFLIVTENRKLCVSPNTPWLLELIKTMKLHCPPDIGYKHRFQFLDEDERHFWNE